VNDYLLRREIERNGNGRIPPRIRNGGNAEAAKKEHQHGSKSKQFFHRTPP